MPGWYDIKSLTRENKDEDKAGMTESLELLKSILEEECKLVGSKNVILGGFR